MTALRWLKEHWPKARVRPGYCFVDGIFYRGGKRPGTTWACNHEECRIKHAAAVAPERETP